MKLLYGKSYYSRYVSIADEIPDNVDVLDVCCGDCGLFIYGLKQRNVSYIGVDISNEFVSAAKRKSISAMFLNLENDPLPMVDYVVLHASLYQFIPNHKKIIDKLLLSARKKLIVCEPIKNLSDSSNPLISNIAKRLTSTAANRSSRFTEKTFRSLFVENYGGIIEKFKFIPGGRELMVIIYAGSIKYPF